MPVRTQNRIALVVAHREVDRARARAIFEETGFTVREAKGRSEALACLRSQGRHAALAFIESAEGGDLPGIDLALNLHAEFPWIHVVVSADDPNVFEELPCACVLAWPWREMDLVVEAERVAHFGSTDELSLADAAKHVTAHLAALDAR